MRHLFSCLSISFLVHALFCSFFKIKLLSYISYLSLKQRNERETALGKQYRPKEASEGPQISAINSLKLESTNEENDQFIALTTSKVSEIHNSIKLDLKTCLKKKSS